MGLLNKKIDFEKLYNNEIDKNLLLQNENNNLKNECLNLRSQVNTLQKEIDFLNEKIHSLNEFKIKPLEDELLYFKNNYDELLEELSKQREELNQFNKNLKPIPKKVTPKLKDQVENMVKSGMTYRDIAKEIDISIKTISRIMTGYYDDKL